MEKTLRYAIIIQSSPQKKRYNFINSYEQQIAL